MIAPAAFAPLTLAAENSFISQFRFPLGQMIFGLPFHP
jgi:hypothetical protein